MTQPLIITRFAPSPTGNLHIGGARTALFCWAFARRQAKEGRGGRFLIRIEDTDQARSSESSARGILEDLAWLGIGWDEGPVLVGRLSEPTVDSENRPTQTLGGDPRHVAPFFQSQRLDIYNRVLDQMIDQGTAYADFSTPEQLAAMRKTAEAAKQTFRFHPAAAEIAPIAEQRRRMEVGEKHVVRFRATDEPITVVDRVLGEVKFGPGEVDDFVLRKADGFPTYHFGVVVDDELMGVTHVLRGQEHLMNTPRHVALQRALGYRTPEYAHMPLIFNDQGAKMSKRERDQVARNSLKSALRKPEIGQGLTANDLIELPGCTIDKHVLWAWLNDSKRQLDAKDLESLARAMVISLPEVSVNDFRAAGYLPEVICNFIALLGWNPGMKNPDGTNLERFDMEFLAANFDLERIGKTNARFDRKKLMAFNADALGKLSDEEFAQRWLAWATAYGPQNENVDRLKSLPYATLVLLARAIKPRSRTFFHALEVSWFALTRDDNISLTAHKDVRETILAPGSTAPALLSEFSKTLKTLEPFNPETINAAVESFAVQRGIKIGDIAQPLRIAVTGSKVSPGLGETLAVLGKESTLRRIERCLARV